jgi:tetratricopeptide (TPR) repeat protein
MLNLHASPLLPWTVALVAAVLWAAGVWWFVKVTGRSRRDAENVEAMRQAVAVGWSEVATLEVMARYPKAPGPVLVYAGQALERKEFDEAIRRYLIAIDLDPQEVSGYVGAERALRTIGRLDEAEAMLRRAQRRFPRDERVLLDLAWNAHRRQDWPEAVRRWETFRKLFPNDPSSYREGAVALREAGRVAEADALFAEAAARFPPPAATVAADP